MPHIATHFHTFVIHCHTLSSCLPPCASLHATSQLIRGILSDKVKFPNPNQFIHHPFLLLGFNMGTVGCILLNQCKLPMKRHKLDQRKLFLWTKGKSDKHILLNLCDVRVFTTPHPAPSIYSLHSHRINSHQRVGFTTSRAHTGVKNPPQIAAAKSHVMPSNLPHARVGNFLTNGG